jgi:hypothetical protein
MSVPLFEDRGGQSNQRRGDGTPQGTFPARMIRE